MKKFNELSLKKGSIQKIINNPMHKVGSSKKWKSTGNIAKADILHGAMYEKPAAHNQEDQETEK